MFDKVLNTPLRAMSWVAQEHIIKADLYVHICLGIMTTNKSKIILSSNLTLIKHL